MKKRRLSAFVIALALAVGSVFPAFAAEHIVDTSKKGSLTIYKYDITGAGKAGIQAGESGNGRKDESVENKLKDYAMEGVEFTCLRVGDVDTYSKNGDVKLIYGIPDILEKILGLEKKAATETKDGTCYYTADQLQTAMRNALADNVTTKNRLEDYVKAGEKMTLTDTTGKTTKAGLELGLYLLVETKVPEDVTDTTDPWFVQLPMTDAGGESWFYDVTCYPKNQTGDPTLDKKVKDRADGKSGYKDTVTASEGAALDYQFISKLPHITSTSTYLSKYTFKDTMAKGLRYGENAVLAFYDSAEKATTTNIDNVAGSGAVAVWTKDSGKFTQDYTKNEDESSQMLLGMTKEGLKEINENYSDKYLVVYYTATVRSEESVVTGDKGNPNDVTLEWRRTSDSYYDTQDDKALVYTYGIHLKKTFSDGKGDATQVQFVLQNQTDRYYVKANGTDGVYYVTGKEEEKNKATDFTPAADGTLLIHGLEGDTYVLTETHSDQGYSLLKEPLQIVIHGTKGVVSSSVKGTESSVQVTAASATVDGTNAIMEKSSTDPASANALVKMEVQNAKGFSLPKTGGRGLYLLTIAGVILAGTGMMFTTGKRKKDEKTPCVK